MSDITTDPKFVPSTEALHVVGLSANVFRNNDTALKFIEDSLTAIDTKDFQISVVVYVLRERGVTNEILAPRFGWSERTITRKYTEGMAILRTQETTRTVAAVRKASLSQTLVDTLTQGLGDSETKMSALEEAAVGKSVQDAFVSTTGKEPTEGQIADVIRLTKEVVVKNAQPETAYSLVNAIPSISETVGLVAKKKTRKPGDAGDSGPYGLEFHFKAALKDAQQIVKDSEGDAYVITPEDATALLALLAYVGVNAEALTAIEVLAAV